MNPSLKAHRPLIPGLRFPLLIEFSDNNYDLLQLAHDNRQELNNLLLQHGALLLRGLSVNQNSFGAFVDVLSGGKMDYTYRSTPRKNVADRVFTATVYPADREILLHCENAYQRDWPMLLAFYCVHPALKGGETPLADVVRVTERIGPELMERFRRRGVRYIRNYTTGIDLPWTEVFQTESRTQVEQFCAEHDIEFAWRHDGDLRTAQTCQGTAIHPRLGTELWFNQAHLFHVSSLGPEVKQDMLDLFGLDGLPRNAVYGDGDVIGDKDLELIRAAFAKEMVEFLWEKNDVLLVDNMQIAHGRHSYVGTRTVLVAMGNPYSSAGNGMNA